MKAQVAPHSSSTSDKLDWIIPGFTGMNNTDDATSLDDTIVQAGLNVVYDSVNAIETRKGTQKLITSTVSGGGILGMHAFYRQTDSIKQLLFHVGAKGYRYDNAGGSVQSTGTFTTGTQWSYVSAFGKTYAVNGTDGLFRYDPLTGVYTLVSATYKFKQILWKRNRLWGFEPNSSLARFSDPGNPESFPASNVYGINDQDGEIITGMIMDNNVMLFHKTSSAWYVSGEPIGAGADTTQGNLQLSPCQSEVGTCAWRTLAKVSFGVQAFVAYDGVYVMQNYTSSNVSPDVDHTFQFDMNPNFMNLCWAVYSRTHKKYIVGYPSATSSICDRLLILDLRDRKEIKYSLFDNIDSSCGVIMNFTDGTESVLIGHPTKGFIFELFKTYADLGGDNGTSTGSNTTTTLKDTTKTWATNQFADAKVTIVEGLGRGQKAVIASNTSNTLTLETTWTITPDATSVYSIGAYDSYYVPKYINAKTPRQKKWHYLDFFTDSEAGYPLRIATSYSYALPGDYSDTISLDAGSMKWGQRDDAGVRYLWGRVGKKWGADTKLHRRLELGGDQSKVFTYKAGNNRALQPWRVSSYVVTLTEKKNRADD